MEGSYIVESRMPWYYSDPRLFESYRQNMQQLGVDQEIVSNDLKDLQRALKPYLVSQNKVKLDRNALHYTSPSYTELLAMPSSLTDIFRRLFSRQKTRVVKSVYRRIQFPLFRLHSPKITGSKVIFQESTSASSEAGWKVTIFGTGMGSSQTIKVSYSTSFVSESGDCKQIFVPVDIRVSKVNTYRGDKLVGEGFRTEPVQHKHRQQVNKGIRLLPPQECLSLSDSPPSEIFPLVGDTPRNITTYKRSWSSARPINISAGFEAHDCGFTATAKIECLQEIQLEYHLPGGRDYYLHTLANMHGLRWTLS